MITPIREAQIFIRSMNHEDLSIVSNIERQSYMSFRGVMVSFVIVCLPVITVSH